MKKIAYFILAVAMLAACKSTKNVQQDGAKDVIVNTQQKDEKLPMKSLSAKLDITAQAMGQKIDVDGKLQMRTNEVIRITITPFGLMEVGRLEFTPDYILLVNRMDKEYCKTTYQEFNTLTKSRLDFYTLQKQLWAEKFVPGKTFNLAVANTGKGAINLTFKLGKVTEDGNWESQTQVNSRYRQVAAQELMAKLIKQ